MCDYADNFGWKWWCWRNWRGGKLIRIHMISYDDLNNSRWNCGGGSGIFFFYNFIKLFFYGVNTFFSDVFCFHNEQEVNKVFTHRSSLIQKQVSCFPFSCFLKCFFLVLCLFKPLRPKSNGNKHRQRSEVNITSTRYIFFGKMFGWEVMKKFGRKMLNFLFLLSRLKEKFCGSENWKV
jgi:hypothetical protein